jgi:hypothetical protein
VWPGILQFQNLHRIEKGDIFCCENVHFVSQILLTLQADVVSPPEAINALRENVLAFIRSVFRKVGITEYAVTEKLEHWLGSIASGNTMTHN